MTLLVTGGAGFVMSNLVRHVLDADRAARAVIIDTSPLDGMAQRFFTPVRDRIEFIQYDICDPGLWSQLGVRDDVRHVVHGAAVTSMNRLMHSDVSGRKDLAGARRAIETNVMGTVDLLAWVAQLPSLKRLINVSSLAALMPGMPGHTLYSGAKSFLVKTSQSLTMELEGTGVHVISICPGFTYTEYHDVIRTRKSVSAYPKAMWMSADEVARQGYDAVMAGKTVYVNGRVNRAFAWLMHLLPDELVMKTGRRQIAEE